MRYPAATCDLAVSDARTHARTLDPRAGHGRRRDLALRHHRWARARFRHLSGVDTVAVRGRNDRGIAPALQSICEVISRPRSSAHLSVSLFHLPAANVTARPEPAHPTTYLAAALSGLLAAATAIAVGHLVAIVIAPAASPLLAVGATFIDLTPEWLKSFAIRTFGSDDKIALLGWDRRGPAVAAVIDRASSAGRRPRLAVAAIGAPRRRRARRRPSSDRVVRRSASSRRWSAPRSAMVALVVLERDAVGRLGLRRAADATGAAMARAPVPGAPRRRRRLIVASGRPRHPDRLATAGLGRRRPLGRRVPAAARSAARPLGRRRPRDRRRRPVRHPERRVLPRRHRPPGPVDRPRRVAPPHPRHGRPRGRRSRSTSCSQLPDDRARHHPDVRLERGRRRVRRERPLDRRPARDRPRAGGRPGRRRPDRVALDRRHDDRHPDRGRPRRPRRDARRRR